MSVGPSAPCLRTSNTTAVAVTRSVLEFPEIGRCRQRDVLSVGV
jgi:hypothetical protein